jgi:hypothetical protein
VKQLIERLHRLHVLDTRASMIRVAAWIIVFGVIIGHVVTPKAPRYTDRATVADNPPTAVRYVAPTSQTDLGGFLPPRHDPKAFTVAWIGGSETKLNTVSVPGEVSRRVTQIGDKPLLIDSYNLVAPRTLDAYLALRSAIDSKADAIVLTINPVWFTPQWSIHDWPNLDVADATAFARHLETTPWLVSSVGPSDATWAALRATLPLLRAQGKANKRLTKAIDDHDPLHKPATPLPTTLPPRPFQPFETDFWLMQYLDGKFPDQSIERLGMLLKGMKGIADREIGERYVKLLLTEAASSGKPVFVYSNPLAFDALDDPVLGPLAAEVKAPNLVVQSQYLTREMVPVKDLFVDVAHMKDAGPMADIVTLKLCDALAGIKSSLTCTRTDVSAEGT